MDQGDLEQLTVQLVEYRSWWEKRPNDREREIREWLAENNISPQWKGCLKKRVIFATFEEATLARARWL